MYRALTTLVPYAFTFCTAANIRTIYLVNLISKTMKKLLIAAALTVAAASAHADWQRIDAPFAEVNLYFAQETVNKIGDRRVQVYHVLDYRSLQQRDGREFRSEMFRNEYDCSKGEFHALAHTWHKGQMGADKMVHFSEGSWYWIKPEAGSVEETLVKAICSMY